MKEQSLTLQKLVELIKEKPRTFSRHKIVKERIIYYDSARTYVLGCYENTRLFYIKTDDGYIARVMITKCRNRYLVSIRYDTFEKVTEFFEKLRESKLFNYLKTKEGIRGKLKGMVLWYWLPLKLEHSMELELNASSTT